MHAISADESCKQQKSEDTLREAYKIQNVNNSISTMGLIRMYKNLLNSDKIKQNGSKLGAYRRLKQLIENK